MHIFTICSNNYLAQAIVLGNSVKAHNPSYTFQIFLCDEKSSLIDYTKINHDITEIGSIESQVYELAKKYNIIELNTAVKPTVFQYLFENPNVNKAIYLDPDICVYSTFDQLAKKLNENSILLTPHIFNSIPLDGKTPGENTFLNYGIYNLGFLALKKDKNTKELLKWWKNITYNQGFIQPANGFFVDQLPINLVPLFFKGVSILEDLGYNMAPWNLHERTLHKKDGVYKVNNMETLKFFHFSSFSYQKIELPSGYNRFSLKERLDLHDIYKSYNQDLQDNKYSIYKEIPCIFVEIRNYQLAKEAELESKNTSLIKKIFLSVKKITPNSIKQLIK